MLVSVRENGLTFSQHWLIREQSWVWSFVKRLDPGDFWEVGLPPPKKKHIFYMSNVTKWFTFPPNWSTFPHERDYKISPQVPSRVQTFPTIVEWLIIFLTSIRIIAAKVREKWCMIHSVYLTKFRRDEMTAHFFFALNTNWKMTHYWF